MFHLVVAIFVASCEPPAAPERVQCMQVYGQVEVEPGASVGVGMPRPITAHDLALWGAALRLDANAAERLRETVDAFYLERTAKLETIVGPVNKLARDLAYRNNLQFHNDPDAPELFRDLTRLRHRAVSMLGTLEDELCVTIANTITTEHTERAALTLKELRRRSRFSSTPTYLPRASVDLREIAFSLERGSSLTAASLDDWTTAWASHDVELAALEDRRVRAQLESIADSMQVYRDSGLDGAYLVEYRTKTLAHKLSVERAIIEANDRWSKALGDALSPIDRERWRNAGAAAEYPQLFPNPIDIAPLVLEVARASVTDHSLVVDAEALSLELRGLAMSEATVRRAIDALALAEAREMSGAESQARLVAQIAELQKERRAVAERVVGRCAASPSLRDLVELKQLRIEFGKYRQGEAAVPMAAS